MLSKLGFIFWLILSPFHDVWAQQLVFSTPIEIKKLEDIEGIDTGNYFIIKGEPSVGVTAIYVIDRNRGTYNLTHRSGGRNSILGYTLTDTELYLFLSNSKNELKKECIIYDRQTSRFTEGDDLRKGDLKKSIVTFNDQDTFMELASSGDDELMLRSYRSDTVIDSRIFSVSNRLFKILNDKPFTFIPDVTDIHFGMARNPYKVYFHEGKLVITNPVDRDDNYVTLNVTSAGITDSMAVEQVLELPFERGTPVNSFLHSNRFFILAVDADFIGLSIFDENLNRIKDFRYVIGTPIAFKGSDLIKDGENLDKQWRGKWSDEQIARYTLKTLKAGIPVISVSVIEDKVYRLLIGSNNIVKGGSVASGSGPAGSPAGYMFMSNPVSYDWRGYDYDYTSRANLYGYLDMEKLEPVEKEWHKRGVLTSVAKRAVELEGKIKLVGYGRIISKESGYLIYLDRGKKTLNIEEFK